MIIIGAIIICSGLVIHAILGRFSRVECQMESRNTQLEIQSRQQKHEMEMFELEKKMLDLEMARKETKKRTPAIPTPDMTPTN